MNYTVTFLGERDGRHRVGVKGVTCASEAESVARDTHPEYKNSLVYDICRSGGYDSVGTSSKREDLEE